MNCFMGYNPLVAKEVKITTWIKEFDGDSPVYPSFPNEGDCFVVFATDEDALTHNALSKKTYTNGEWADAIPSGTIEITENGEGIDVSEYAYADVNVSGGVDYPTFTVGESLSCDMTYAEARANLLANCDTNYMWIAKWMWDGGELVTSWLSDAEVIQEDFEDVPETVTEGIALARASDATLLYALFAEDGNFYKPKT